MRALASQQCWSLLLLLSLVLRGFLQVLGININWLLVKHSFLPLIFLNLLGTWSISVWGGVGWFWSVEVGGVGGRGVSTMYCIMQVSMFGRGAALFWYIYIYIFFPFFGSHFGPLRLEREKSSNVIKYPGGTKEVFKRCTYARTNPPRSPPRNNPLLTLIYLHKEI